MQNFDPFFAQAQSLVRFGCVPVEKNAIPSVKFSPGLHQKFAYEFQLFEQCCIFQCSIFLTFRNRELFVNPRQFYCRYIADTLGTSFSAS